MVSSNFFAVYSSDRQPTTLQSKKYEKKAKLKEMQNDRTKKYAARRCAPLRTIAGFDPDLTVPLMFWGSSKIPSIIFDLARYSMSSEHDIVLGN